MPNNPSLFNRIVAFAGQSWQHALGTIIGLTIAAIIGLKLAGVAVVKFVDTFGVFLVVAAVIWHFFFRNRGK